MSDSRVQGASIFISHASEDKDAIARPLAEELRRRGMDVWFDELSLVVGDSLRREIDRGLALARFGVVILSVKFFEKEWPQRELDALVARETAGASGLILPVWHEIDRATVIRYSPTLGDRMAALSSHGVDAVADHIVKAVQRTASDPASRGTGDRVPPVMPFPPPAGSSSQQPSLARSSSRFEWHPLAHARWGRAKLWFVELGFSSTYDRSAAVEGVARAVAAYGVRSWMYDEVFGGHDAMLRFWLPGDATQHSFEKALRRELNQIGISTIRFLSVSDILRHWVWQSATERGLRHPDEETLRKGVSSQAVTAVEDGVVNGTEAMQLIHHNLIAPVGSSPGIRFYTTVILSRLDRYAQDAFAARVTAIVDDAAGIDEPAVYRCDGFVQFLITGKATTDQFTRLESDLIEPINTVAGTFGARSLTTLASTADIIHQVDGLSGAGA